MDVWINQASTPGDVLTRASSYKSLMDLEIRAICDNIAEMWKTVDIEIHLALLSVSSSWFYPMFTSIKLEFFFLSPIILCVYKAYDI